MGQSELGQREEGGGPISWRLTCRRAAASGASSIEPPSVPFHSIMLARPAFPIAPARPRPLPVALPALRGGPSARRAGRRRRHSISSRAPEHVAPAAGAARWAAPADQRRRVRKSWSLLGFAPGRPSRVCVCVCVHVRALARPKAGSSGWRPRCQRSGPIGRGALVAAHAPPGPGVCAGLPGLAAAQLHRARSVCFSAERVESKHLHRVQVEQTRATATSSRNQPSRAPERRGGQRRGRQQKGCSQEDESKIGTSNCTRADTCGKFGCMSLSGSGDFRRAGGLGATATPLAGLPVAPSERRRASWRPDAAAAAAAAAS